MQDEVIPLHTSLKNPEITKTTFSIKMGVEAKGKPGTKEGILLCFGNFSGFQFSSCLGLHHHRQNRDSTLCDHN